MGWLNRRRQRKLLRACRFYGLELDEYDIAVQGVKLMRLGDIIFIIRKLSPESFLSLPADFPEVVQYQDAKDKRIADARAAALEKELSDPEKFRRFRAQQREQWTEIFRLAVLWPSMERHDPSGLADNMEIGSRLFAEIMQWSLGGKKKANP